MKIFRRNGLFAVGIEVLALAVLGIAVLAPHVAMAEPFAPAPAVAEMGDGAVCAAPAANLGVPDPILLATQKCCLAEWQPGGCPPGTFYLKVCTVGTHCQVCGAPTCVTNPGNCLN